MTSGSLPRPWPTARDCSEEASAEGTRRFRLLDVVRRYAAEKATGIEEARARHDDYYAAIGSTLAARGKRGDRAAIELLQRTPDAADLGGRVTLRADQQ